jgi:two-component system OmpR family sensor kinase
MEKPTAIRGNQERLLVTLQKLLTIPAGNLSTALTHAANAVTEALAADKVDAFLYDESRDSLVAVGTSTQPLSNLQKKLGLDVLQLSNGGRVVEVFQTGKTFSTGDLQADPDELRGVKEGLGVRSEIGVPITIGGKRVGMMMIASLEQDYFTPADASFSESITHWVGVVAHRAQLIEDIERNAVEEAHRAVAEELVTMLAHDLRNYVSPLQMRLYAMRLRAGRENRTTDVDDVNAGLKSLSCVNALVSNLLDVARLDEGAFQFEFAPVDLVALAKEAADVLATPEHPVSVDATDAITVGGDAMRIRQCIANLVSNAVTYSPKNAPVSVFISKQNRDGGEWARLEVVDEGPGIPEDLIPNIFDRYVSKRYEQGGLGLGLYIAKRVAAAHGGDLTVERALGKGARFAMTLPLFKEEAAAQRAVGQPLAAPGPDFTAS